MICLDHDYGRWVHFADQLENLLHCAVDAILIAGNVFPTA